MIYAKYIKRVIDFIISLLGIVILSPILLVLILLIKITSPGPVFFKQKRVGIHKTYFNIYKFRTTSLVDSPPKNQLPFAIIAICHCHLSAPSVICHSCHAVTRRKAGGKVRRKQAQCSALAGCGSSSSCTLPIAPHRLYLASGFNSSSRRRMSAMAVRPESCS